MKHNLITIIFILHLSLIYTYAQETPKVTVSKPKLIVGITISQFRYDYITRFWDKFCEDGFKQLITRGTYCENTSYNYLYSDMGVGCATIASGTNPSFHGIIARSWYNNLKGELVDCVFDNSVNTVGGSFDMGRYSPKNLMTTTFTDEIQIATNFKSRVIAISVDPVQAIFSAGHTANAAYWFDPQKGNWVTSSYYMDSLPKWVLEFNNKRLADIYLNNEWNTFRSLNEYTESLPDNNIYEKGIYGKKIFPYVLKDLVKSNSKLDKYEILNFTPYSNNLTKDFAIAAMLNEDLGKDEFTDVLTISFTSTERIGNLFGPLSVEMEDAILRLDREISHLLQYINREIGKENVLIYLTAEHSLMHLPEYLQEKRIPSGYFNSQSALSLLKIYMTNTYGKGDWIKLYYNQQIYLNRTLIEDSKLSPEKIQEDVARFMLQFSGISSAMTATALQRANFTSGVFGLIQNGYNQKRSGDIMLGLLPGWIETTDLKKGLTPSYGYESRIPLIWYGWKIGRSSIKYPVELIDIAPTICSLLEISYPNSATGKPIQEMVK